jgi:hypothetical protein
MIVCVLGLLSLKWLFEDFRFVLTGPDYFLAGTLLVNSSFAFSFCQ